MADSQNSISNPLYNKFKAIFRTDRDNNFNMSSFIDSEKSWLIIKKAKQKPEIFSIISDEINLITQKGSEEASLEKSNNIYHFQDTDMIVSSKVTLLEFY